MQNADDIFVEEVGANIRFDPVTCFHVRCHKQPRPFCENFPTTHGFKPVALFQLGKFEDNAVVIRTEVRHGRMHALYLNRIQINFILLMRKSYIYHLRLCPFFLDLDLLERLLCFLERAKPPFCDPHWMCNTSSLTTPHSFKVRPDSNLPAPGL